MSAQYLQRCSKASCEACQKATFKFVNANFLLSIFHSEPTEERKGRILLQNKWWHREGERACQQQYMWSGYIYAVFCVAIECSGKESRLLWWSVHPAAAGMTGNVGIHRHLLWGYQPKGAWNVMIMVIQLHAVHEFWLTCRSCCFEKATWVGADSSALLSNQGKQRPNLHNLGQWSQRAGWSLGRLAGFKHHYQQIHFSALWAV